MLLGTEGVEVPFLGPFSDWLVAFRVLLPEPSRQALPESAWLWKCLLVRGGLLWIDDENNCLRTLRDSYKWQSEVQMCGL